MKGIFELDAAQPIEGNNLLLIDALNLAFRYKHKRQRNFAADYVRTVESFAKSYNATKIIICADQGSSSFRKEIYPAYKGNRKEKYKTQTEEEAKAFKEFLEDFEEAMELCKLRFPQLRFQGVEADDIIAVIAKQATAVDHIWIISSDKDLDQLIGETVSRFCYFTRKEITIDTFEAKYGCAIDDYISRKVLHGDMGDNVPGVPGVGDKRALGLIRDYGSAFDIYDALPLPGKQKYIQAVNEFGEQLLTNYKLMDLSFSYEAVGDANLSTIYEVLNEQGIT